MKFLQIMRPHHWIKNILVFAALIFGQKLYVFSAVAGAVGAFSCFCIASSAVYIFNDIVDRRMDKLHPEKRNRPIAAGTLSVNAAAAISILCAVVAVSGALVLNRQFGIIIILYILLMLLYSLLLKKAMILDCLTISIGFCLRAVAGAVVVGVFISHWLIICTFALCLFLAFSKRRCEIAQFSEHSESFRQTLGGYTPELLAHMVNVTSGLAVASFLLYATDDGTEARFGTINLAYTTPLVLYCVFRLSALTQQGKFSGPVQLILSDTAFQVGFVLWVLACIGIIYYERLGIDFGGI
ncbi:MAG: decaprenyl-phosphate phosphoribosyltransferase [Phycisphaerales bacterium]|nr:MAG: decaprenyl-phosphate phosphoribosyltransferase [Phycisphaerales bacterium]